IHQRRGDPVETFTVHVLDAHPPAPPAKVEAPAEIESEEPEQASALDALPELPELTLDVRPLEAAEPVDLSLDVTMPTFDEASGAAAAPPSLRDAPPLTGDDLPSLDALESLTLDLPPLP